MLRKLTWNLLAGAGKGGGVVDINRARTGLDAVDLEHAAADGGGAAVAVEPAQGERAGPGLGQLAAGDDAVVGQGVAGGHVDRAGGAVIIPQENAAVGIEREGGRRLERVADDE